MLYRNRTLDRAFQFIKESDFDIFCLQEVPEEFLRRLRELPYPIAFRVDKERLIGKTASPHFVVILSKHPITAQNEITFPDYWSLMPLRARIFIFLMHPFYFARVRNRNGLYADVSPAGEIPLRVFNLHLMLAQPAWRLEEFKFAMLKHNLEQPTIVCGDFNILEAPHITLLNWIFGGRITDAVLYTRERTIIEQHFIEHRFTNALRGKTTHPFSRSQLDHILVSQSFSIKNAEVLSDRIGSDHHPLRVELFKVCK